MKIEWWDGGYSKSQPQRVWVNPDYVSPDPLSNVRDLF